MRHHTILARSVSSGGPRGGTRGHKGGAGRILPHALPMVNSPEHVKAAEAATRDLNRYFMGPMLEGRYDDAYLKAAGKDAPKFTDDEMKIIGSPLDFVGVNVYIPTLLVMAFDQPPGYREVPFNNSHPKMFSSWHRLSPKSQYWAPRLLHSLWRPKEIYISENGCAANDTVAADGNVYDSDRLMYLRNGMLHQQRATAEGIPLKGNFVWSAMDNFEWNDGYGTRFGIVFVDFKTQKAHPKLVQRGIGRPPRATRWCSLLVVVTNVAIGSKRTAVGRHNSRFRGEADISTLVLRENDRAEPYMIR